MNNVNVLQLLQSKIGSADWSKWQIHRYCNYDYVRYPVAGTTQIQHFVNPIGSTDPTSGLGKTYEQTNLPKSRSFGQVYTIITEIRTHLFILPKLRQASAISTDADVLVTTMTNAMDEIYNIIGDGVLNLQIGQKAYYQIIQPFRFAPPGFGVHIYKHAAITGAQGSWATWVTQSYRLGDIYAVTPYQLVEPEQAITCTIDFPEGSPASLTGIVNGANLAVDVGVIFDGYQVRPAQ